MRRYSIAIALAAVCALQSSPSVSAENLIRNGSFEHPVVPQDSQLQVFNVGQKLSGWIVTGPTPGATGVYVIGENYTEAGGQLHFTPKFGAQAVDLTGPYNQGPIGVEQQVATTAGARYKLVFYLGNQDNSYTNYGLASSAQVDIDGVSQGVFTNDRNTPNNINWQRFVVEFTATRSRTVIQFVNRTPPADYYCGLDGVSVQFISAQSGPNDDDLFGE